MMLMPPLHQLGNYFGALVNWVKLQSTAGPGDKLFFSVVGWHALTLPQDPRLLSEARVTMMAAILASGIDAQRAVVFHQDEVTTQVALPIRFPTDASNRSRTMQSFLGS
jgi:tryptophanyl-tRNA synthetase